LAETDFRSDILAVRRGGADWYICDENQALIRAGEKEENAKKLLEIIRRYKFDALCRIGTGEAGAMSILVRTQ
jgi:hypothetical protein